MEKFIQKHNNRFFETPADDEDAHRPLEERKNEDLFWMPKEEKALSKNLSFQYKGSLYQIKSNRKYSLAYKRVTAYIEGKEVVRILRDGKDLPFNKWKEKVSMPPPVLDAKELEALVTNGHMRWGA